MFYRVLILLLGNNLQLHAMLNAIKEKWGFRKYTHKLFWKYTQMFWVLLKAKLMR